MNIQYREPNSLKELESLFRLRQLVYSEDPLLHEMVHSSDQIDVNQYDLNAFHFGAFQDKKPIAYIRITSPIKTHFTPWVEKIIQQNKIVFDLKSTFFPFQNYHPDSNWSISFLASLEGRKIGEVGKLAIHKNNRIAGIVLDHLIVSFIDYCKKEQRFDTGFGACSLKLIRYYRKFGFKIAEGAQPFIHNMLPEAVIVQFDNEF